MSTIHDGPDFSNCGNPVNWTDSLPMDERFGACITEALSTLAVDIEICKWSPDDVYNDQYVAWWNGQRASIRREITLLHLRDIRTVIHRRTDKGDGMMKCYIAAYPVKKRKRDSA